MLAVQAQRVDNRFTRKFHRHARHWHSSRRKHLTLYATSLSLQSLYRQRLQHRASCWSISIRPGRFLRALLVNWADMTCLCRPLRLEIPGMRLPPNWATKLITGLLTALNLTGNRSEQIDWKEVRGIGSKQRRCNRESLAVSPALNFTELVECCQIC